MYLKFMDSREVYTRKGAGMTKMYLIRSFLIIICSIVPMIKNIRNWFFLLISIVLLLLAMHIITRGISVSIHRRFDLDNEANIPSWYSTILLFSISLISFLTFKIEAVKNNVGFVARNFWLVFSLFYCFLSLDEAARIHETIDGYTQFKWVVVYAPFAGMFFLMTAYYTIKLVNDNKLFGYWILAGLVIYAVGGMGAEMIQYIYYPLSKPMLLIEVMIEEGLEMTGTVMVLMGCLLRLEHVHAAVYTPRIND